MFIMKYMYYSNDSSKTALKMVDILLETVKATFYKLKWSKMKQLLRVKLKKGANYLLIV